MKSILAKSAVAISLAAFAMGAAHADKSKWPKSFTVGTASQGGTYYAYGAGWANLVAETVGITGGAEVTGGPTQNLALVHTGKLAFGMTTMGPAREALDGKSPLAPGLKMNKVCAMFPMYETPFSVTVLSSSGIKSIKDIPAGSKIGFGPAGSTSDVYFPKMLETLGVKFERRNGGWGDLGGQLQDGLIDVVAFAAGVPIPAVTQLEVQTDINILEFNEAEQKKIIDAYPVSAFPIKASTYKTLKNDARAVSMWNYAIANCDLPESFVYEATKAVLDNNAKMMNIHKGARTTLTENWDKNTLIPFHPGAVKYFEEKGIKIPANLKLK
ncbi:TAXI family TRAP transporter solute-binding subunit [Limnobacter parvus]|uniref:TAXI family TRAP transporter solute-binding subunit n=1 Tax=Limnobacter parvus TaxID=2939690 RepID=A0ABT1XH98_9BURK|nr:TAXI family TRAP transporter solute-binding subunit [Limnobacter parvus]MCR2746668.1 TAXI family TRAP transporter solute-binding subunit [Limnobacter parvus]